MQVLPKSSAPWYESPPAESTTLVVRGRLPSHNSSFGGRGSGWDRQALNKKWGLLVMEAIGLAGWFPRTIPWPVDLEFTAYMTAPLLDASNICVKPLEDALRGKVLTDDSYEWVRSVIQIPRRVKLKRDQLVAVTFKPCA